MSNSVWQCQHLETYSIVYLPYHPEGPYSCLEFVPKTDYDALQADRDEQYAMKVKAHEQLNTVAAALREIHDIMGMLALGEFKHCEPKTYSARKVQAGIQALLDEVAKTHNLRQEGHEYIQAGLAAENAMLREALGDAAQSLETIDNLAGRDECMAGMVETRSYARSRAGVARAALAGSRGGL